MDIQEILKELEHFEEGKFPRKALKEAIAQRETITPELLKILEWAKDHIEEIYESSTYMAHTYALFLLAQFREKQAYPLIVKFFSIPGEMPTDVSGDIVTEDLHKILAAVSHGEMGPMMSLAENDQVDEYTRDAALTGLTTLVACGEVPREDVMAYFQSLFRGKLERTFSHVWNGLVEESTRLYPEEVYEDIKQAYKDELVEPFFIHLKDVEEVLAQDKEKVLQDLRNDPRYHLITDTISEMECWACFRTPEQERKRIKKMEKLLKKQAKKLPSPRHESPKSQPVTRKTKKVGRNDPCPCGSGKKYKKCCLNK